MMDYCCGDDSVAALDAELAGLPGLLGELQSTMNLLTDLRGLMAQAEQELIDYETLCFATELRAVKAAQEEQMKKYQTDKSSELMRAKFALDQQQARDRAALSKQARVAQLTFEDIHDRSMRKFKESGVVEGAAVPAAPAAPIAPLAELAPTESTDTAALSEFLAVGAVGSAKPASVPIGSFWP
eukprot:m.749450 g.749450  ORF g.749450 m.749450 type:complete len:184 (+) comp58976_c0_seq5:63-614(+)